MKPYVSIVVPVYNEEESVSELVARITAAGDRISGGYELILIDDGSTDQTWKLIESLKGSHPVLRAIKFRRNFGQTAAMVAGFDNAQGEVIVTMDGDLQNDPADIPLLLAKLEEGYDIVSGWRRDRQDHFARVWPSRVANFIISFTTGVKLHDYGCSLKAYRTECVRSLQAYGEMHRFFPALAKLTGAKVAEIPVRHYPRQYGVSKYGFDRILKVFSDIFSMNMIIRFSSFPLAGFALLALPFAFLTVFFGLVALMAMVFEWTSGKALFFFFASALPCMAVVQLVVLGILAELVIGTSDLEHTQLPEITMQNIDFEHDTNDPS
jgi:glycosyltransferase involved in cell wall biosynthesis